MGNCVDSQPQADNKMTRDTEVTAQPEGSHQVQPGAAIPPPSNAMQPEGQQGMRHAGDLPSYYGSTGHLAQYPTHPYSYMAHPAYGMHVPMMYPGDPVLTAGYYHNTGPVLVMDPYTGVAYELDNRHLDGYLDDERAYRRRKDRTKRSSKLDEGVDGEDDEKNDDDVDDHNGDKDHRRHKHRRHSSRPEKSEEGQKQRNRQRKESRSTANKDHVTSVPEAKRPANYQPRDVMISYSRSDTEIMRKIKDKLEEKGITVWVDVASIDAGSDFLSKIGEAIIDAKLLVCVLSSQAVQSRYCRDEVALAYVSNTAIYPVNVQPREDLLPLMDTGLKLQLSNYNWTSLTDANSVDNSIDTLVANMKAELDELRQLTEEGPLGSPQLGTSITINGGDNGTSPSDVILVNGEQVSGPHQNVEFKRELSDHKGKQLRERNPAYRPVEEETTHHLTPEQFWIERCGISDRVTWDRFKNALLEEFREPVQQTFTPEDREQLLDILRREMEVDEEGRLFKYQFIAFCSRDGQVLPVWQCVHEQARESFAMREVFNMDSSVRVETIENLGKFRSAAVVDALRVLLTDPDANVRAVATVSLSRTDTADPVTVRHILRMLSDKDRLVREAGCLALGHLKAKQAVSKLTHIWRNDVISHVREAAAVALRQIGGQDVDDAMRVTKVLAEEIRSLTEVPS